MRGADPSPAVDAPAAARPGHATTFRPDIEGLRALAILLVVAYHAKLPGVTGGYVGVDVFFVLSGYLITGLLLTELRRTGRLDLPGFYARRVRRLLPALAVVLLVCTGLGMVVLAPFEQRVLANTALATAAYLSNVWFTMLATDYLGASTQNNPLLHTWSLGLEEQFYLLWPLLILAVLPAAVRERPRHVRQRVLVTMAVVIGLSFAVAVMLTSVRQPMAFFLLPGRAWEFALGGLGAVLVTRPAAPRFPPWTGVVVGGGSLAVLLAVAFRFDATTGFPGPFALIPALATLAVLVVGQAWPRGVVVRVLSVSPLQTLGRLSYSWYLWHWPVLVFGAAIAGPLALPWRLALVAGALVLAALSYRWVENPLRRHRALGARPARALGMAAVLTLGCLAAGTVWRQLSLRWVESPQHLAYARARDDLPEVYASGCIQDFYAQSPALDRCTGGHAGARYTAVLLGDSHAAQWHPALADLAQTNDWRLVTLTKYACPAVDTPKFSEHLGRRYHECEQWRDEALRGIESLRPDLVVLASSAQQSFTPEQWRAGTARVLDRLSPASRAVVVLRDTPRPGVDLPTCLARRAWMAGWVPRPGCALDGAAQATRPVFEIQQAVAAAYPNVVGLDMTDVLCPDGVCDPAPGGVLAFRDADHLTRSHAQALAPAFQEHLAASLPPQALAAAHDPIDEIYPADVPALLGLPSPGFQDVSVPDPAAESQQPAGGE